MIDGCLELRSVPAPDENWAKCLTNELAEGLVEVVADVFVLLLLVNQLICTDAHHVMRTLRYVKHSSTEHGLDKRSSEVSLVLLCPECILNV